MLRPFNNALQRCKEKITHGCNVHHPSGVAHRYVSHLNLRALLSQLKWLQAWCFQQSCFSDSSSMAWRSFQEMEVQWRGSVRRRRTKGEKIKSKQDASFARCQNHYSFLSSFACGQWKEAFLSNNKCAFRFLPGCCHPLHVFVDPKLTTTHKKDQS